MAPSRSALSPLLFTDGVLDPGACGDRRTHDVLRAASERLRPGDVLFAVLAGRDPAVLPALEAALAEGAAPQHLMAAIDVYDPPGTAYGFDGSPGRIAPELMAAFADLAAESRRRRADRLCGRNYLPCPTGSGNRFLTSEAPPPATDHQVTPIAGVRRGS
ncbi:hypothetical protein ACIBL8_43575 [Streptomyces sp. NPDC050523]|uniref:hypothetical protein n=1 Tax=Streptomyces sp. NPDC050523 TaxID=3365622 RepID=UPI0037B23069